MSWWSELIFNAGSGGLFGLAGTVATTWLRLSEKKLDYAHQLALAEKQAASAEAAAAWGAFAASHQSAAADMSEKVSPWAANVRAVTRPFLTGVLVLAAVAVAFVSPPEARRDAISSVQMLAGTAVAWWFGSRMSEKMGAVKK